MDAEAYRGERAAEVDRALRDWLPPADAPPARLHAAMHHLLFPGGKRLRPAFALAAAEAVGDRSRALPVAVAVELVHTYSLVHDDLPCMDDDAERRGRPTVHVAFDEATAVLAGDALQAEAFRVLAECGCLAPDERAQALRELATAAGSRGLVGGQVDDLAPGDAGAAGVEEIHRRKTAALFRASIVAGAAVSGADAATLRGLRSFAEAVGIAFQIADDLLDRGRDEPTSLVNVLGAQAARARAEALLVGALEGVEALGEPAEPLRELARYAVRRNL